MGGGLERRDRPIADLDHAFSMLRCGPSIRTFAATAKSVEGRIHRSRTKLPFLPIRWMSASTDLGYGLVSALNWLPSPRPFVEVNGV